MLEKLVILDFINNYSDNIDVSKCPMAFICTFCSHFLPIIVWVPAGTTD